MFSKLRGRLTYTNVLLTLVLVFAMTGGAYAAGKYAITSTKQISPKVLKTLTGKTGPAGKEGSPGKDGAPGKEGPAGKDGAPGKEGPAAKEGPQGPQGEPGPTGPQGPTGPAGKEGAAGKNGTTGFTKTLPTGETETGTWSTRFEKVAEGSVLSAISFAIPLKIGLEEGHAHYVASEPCKGMEGSALSACEGEEKELEKFCPGSAATPRAASGNLCLYQGYTKVPSVGATEPEPKLSILGVVNPTHVAASSTFEAGATGAIVVVKYEEGPEGGNAYIEGSWAVTAP